MTTLKDYRDERLQKLEKIRALGVSPYPAKASRTVEIGELVRDFDKIMQDAADDKNGLSVNVVGRIKSIRKFGKLAFVVIADASGEVQLFLKSGDVLPFDAKTGNLGLENINLLDTGDFVGVTGDLGKSKTGEISVFVQTLKLLTKALRPMPLAHENFDNQEERFRRRYVDMNVNTEVRERFLRRSKFWQATRDFLNSHGFSEININVLEHTTGGADANAFKTHFEALDQDVFLRISHELPLKRLIGAGFEKVYDIGARFRNEGIDDEHLPEHIGMEWYAAYWDWNDGMKFMEELYRTVALATWGKTKFLVRGFEVDFEKTWDRIDYSSVIFEKYGIDVLKSSLEDIKKALKDNDIEIENAENRARGIDKLWKKIRKDIAGPAWLVNVPKFISPLAKSSVENAEIAERFQSVIAGSELGNGFSELNDPIDQLERFVEQQNMRDAGDAEAMMLDIDFVEMLEYGMPPACGWGHSERVFWFLENVSAKEGVPFPMLKHEVSELTKSIYPDLYYTTDDTKMQEATG
ncbi:MAG: lysine--tRNA ligase [Candidatus Nomurabacteria bacterium]|jgi:lysyl-tRNA synthetase class 2|nr:lysine--tRNA ligase [Candidatus Nomurabacteria bacterium]